MAPELTRQFVWTSLPVGRVETIDGQPTALLSLLLTPRLLGPSGSRLTVTDFGMQAWPQWLARTGFAAVRAGSQVPLRRVPMRTADGRQVTFSLADQQAAWQALLPATTLVRPYRASSYDGRPVKDFPASEAGAQIRGAYSRSARVYAEYDGAAPDRALQRRSALQEITDEWHSGLWRETGESTADRLDPSPLRRAFEFYRRGTTDFTPFEPESERAPEELDFHDIVARLNDHPVLLRALGLLGDFGIPVAALTGSGDTTLRIAPQWSTDTTPPTGWPAREDVSLRTVYTLTDTRFLPASRAPSAGVAPVHGLLPLAKAGPAGIGTNPRFEIMGFDVDGAALRMVSVAESDRDQPPADDGPGLPTLRSMGFAVVEKTRVSTLEERLHTARERATPDALAGLPLTADDVVAGYRVDVFDQSVRRWFSLCQRRVRYSIGGVQIGQGTVDGVRGLLEEGCVRRDSVTTGAGPADALYLHQIVARWDGWSLVIARPERVRDPAPVPSLPFTVHVELEPGSLPRLRFGREYRIRARHADLAGGGLRRDQVSTTEQQSEKFVHRRFEPIPPPEIAPTRAYVDGERQNQLVIRSDRGVSAAAYAAAHGYQASNVRYLFPPKSSLELALQHGGTFDTTLGPNTPGPDVNSSFGKAKRADLDMAQVPGVQFINDPSGSGHYFAVPDAHVAVPWLADWASCSVAVLVKSRPHDPHAGGEGPTSGLNLHWPWKGRWPDRVSMALRLAEAASGCTGSMTLQGNNRTITVALGPAEQVTLKIASCPDSDDVTSLGLADWAGATHDPPNDIFDNVYAGRNPMVTPPSFVTLVHAVQRPKVDPGGQVAPNRKVRDTHVVLGLQQLTLDVRSTGRIDIRAEWTDDIDIGSEPPSRKTITANVGSFDVAHKPLLGPDAALPPIRQEFTDTRRRRVTYRVTAVSRFREYFGKITATNPEACTVEGVLQVTDVPSSERPPAPALRYVMPTATWTRSGEGTTVIRSARRGGGIRVFLERPWYVSGADEALAVIAWTSSSVVPPGAALVHLSLAGRDPTWDTTSPAMVLTPEHFNAAGSTTEYLREARRSVAAVPHTVRFDREANCWIAEVDLASLVESSYFPFVRLGLARYQSYTVDRDERLSPPVVCEPIQLLPHRDLRVTLGSGRATAVVSGIGTGGSRPTTVRGELQVFEGQVSAADDALVGPGGWRMIAQKSGLLGVNLQFDIPASGGRPMRIAVTEVESYPAAGAAESATRVVYADTVGLPAT